MVRPYQLGFDSLSIQMHTLSFSVQSQFVVRLRAKLLRAVQSTTDSNSQARE